MASLPEVKWHDGAHYVLFALGGFAPDLVTLPADPTNRLHPIGDTDELSDQAMGDAI